MTEIKQLLELLKKGVSPAHVVSACMNRLRKAGFEEIEYGTQWKLEAGKKYVICHHATTLFAFTLPKARLIRGKTGRSNCRRPYGFSLLSIKTFLRYQIRAVYAG